MTDDSIVSFLLELMEDEEQKEIIRLVSKNLDSEEILEILIKNMEGNKC